MSSLAGNTIRDRLVRMQLIVTVLVLSTSVISFIVLDLRYFKRAMVRSLDSTARILGTNVGPAVAFQDPKEANKVLQSLKADKNILAAKVYDGSGTIFSSYGPIFDVPRPSATAPHSWSYFEGNHLFVFQRIGTEGESGGLLVLKSDARVLREDYRTYSIIVIGVIIFGLMLGYGLARAMQGTLSRPISNLVHVTRQISESGDYSLRVGEGLGKKLPEELSSLSTEFDRMLEQIAAKDTMIKETNQLLEAKVEERTEALQKSQKAALTNAHAAGMAEIATGTLHNIGNLVNSIGVSIEEIQGSMNESCLGGLNRAMAMLNANRDNIAGFLSADPKGAILPDYLREGFASLHHDHERVRSESLNLFRKVKMIKDVVATQQAYAKGNFLLEEVDLASVVEDILAMQDTAFHRHSIDLEKRIAPVPIIKIHRTKLAHIILNLVKNAKEAMNDRPDGSRKMVIEIGQNLELGIYLRVSDTGEGIQRENLKKIFNHGFTTKQTGHGFGLHFCANAMVEMGGRLSVSSEGLGLGASFTLAFGNGQAQGTSPDLSSPVEPLTAKGEHHS